jgi:hypothetical protein
VLAVGSDKLGDLAQDWFLFSTISTRAVRRLIERMLGFRFGIAKMLTQPGSSLERDGRPACWPAGRRRELAS